MAEFQIIYGRKDQPKEDWLVFQGHGNVTDIWGNPQEANAACKKLNADFKASYGQRNYAAMLKRLPDPVDYLSREAGREDYAPFEVQGEDFHCAELKSDGTISYYSTLYNAYDDRRTNMKVGRYLKQFTDKDDNEISTICARYGYEFGDAKVQFAKTRDEIKNIYMHGPSSCMSDSADGYNTDDIHPSEVYASGDFEVAYLTRNERITARTVVIPSKKVWISIYGDCDRMIPALEELGYKRSEGDEAYGLRILHLKSENGNVACPYFDFSGGVGFDPEDTDKLIITRGGDSGGEEGYLKSDLSYPDDDDEYDWDY